MHCEKALEIIQLLADGVDPVSGEVFPKDSPYNHSEVTRALYHATWLLQEEVEHAQPAKGTRSALSPGIKKGRRPRQEPKNSGNPWSEDSDRALLRGLDEGKTIQELATVFGRSHGAISSRCERLGIDPNVRRRVVAVKKLVNQGKRWSKEDRARLITEFDRGASINSLATMLGRTRKSVEVKLYFSGRNSEDNR